MINNPETGSETHNLFLLKDGSQYYYPIIFEGCMDAEECGIYYDVVDAQQNGGISRQRKQSHRTVSRDSEATPKAAPISILKKSRYTKSTNVFPQPNFVRRFSFSNHVTLENDTKSTCNKLRRSNSMCHIEAPRVSFHHKVHIVTIQPIHEIPFDVRHNLWMTHDELMTCMHGAAVAKIEEEVANRQQQELLEEEQVKAPVERRNSSTSVIDDDDLLNCYNQIYFR